MIQCDAFLMWGVLLVSLMVRYAIDYYIKIKKGEGNVDTSGFSPEHEALSKYIEYLKGEIAKLDLVSSYSKVALIERRIDRLTTERDALAPVSSSASNSSATTSLIFRLLPINTIATSISSSLIPILFLIFFWGSPVATLPSSWLGPFIYPLALPDSPYGSISITAWSLICNRIIDFIL